MGIKCILFDADGVVINSELFSIQYKKKFGIGDNEITPFFIGEFQKCIVGKTDLKQLLKPWLPKWKWGKSVDDFLKFWFESEHNIDDRMINIINSLKSKGIKCCLATNQEQYRTKYMKNEMGFKNVFDKVYSSCEIGYKKPDKEFYLHILKKLKNDHNILPQEILFFDDSSENINSAKNYTKINAHIFNDFEKFEKIIKSIEF